MKPTKYILLLVLSIVFTANSIAQKQKSKPINSGFVFIDGKYIEPPYVVKYKDTAIYINNIPVYIDTTEGKPFIPEKLPNYYDYFNDSTEFNELFKKRIINNFTFYNLTYFYFLSKYKEDEGLDSLCLFFQKTPIVDKCYKSNEWIGTYVFEDMKGILQSKVLSVSSFHSIEKNIFYNKCNNTSKKELKKDNIEKLKNEVVKYSKQLSNNNVIIVYGNKYANYSGYNNTITTQKLIKQLELKELNINKINIDTLNNESKEKLKKIENTNNLKKRLNNNNESLINCPSLRNISL